MKPATQIRDVVSSGDIKRGTFGISLADSAHLMGILRDGLYTDQIMAVLREYSSNAWDAHKEAGIGDKPIKVHIPTRLEPDLTIRDYGCGLSEKDIFNVFTQYGASTKRSSNTAVGMLGIGGKSGFCYSDSFTVTSWHAGVKKIYIAVLDDTDTGEMNKLHEEPCGDETGVEVQIPVKMPDLNAFRTKARYLYTYFDPQPDSNIDLPSPIVATNPYGFLATPPKKNNGAWEPPTIKWTAVMGCIPYRLDTNQMRDLLVEEEIWDSVAELSGVLYFDIGEVRVAANREELKYTDRTCRSIVQRFRDLIDAHVEKYTKVLAGDTTSMWEKRMATQYLAKTLKITVPPEYRGWADTYAQCWVKQEDAPKTFTLIRNGTGIRNFMVGEGSRLIIKDDSRKLSSFSLTPQDTLVRPLSKADLDTVKAELAVYIDKASLTGVPTVNLSDVTFRTRVSAGWSPSIPNPKHKKATFKLLNNQAIGYKYPWSENWEAETRVPTKDDVYIIVSAFQCVRWSAFYETVLEDRKIAKWMKIDFPVVYGYKTTKTKPVSNAVCVGTHYREWRKTFFKKALTAEIRKQLRAYQWARLGQKWGIAGGGTASKLLGVFQEELGKDHFLTKAIRKYITENDRFQKSTLTAHRCRSLFNLISTGKTASDRLMERVETTYPLLKHTSFTNLSGTRRFMDLVEKDNPHWFQYIRLMDQALKESGPSKTV